MAAVPSPRRAFASLGRAKLLPDVVAVDPPEFTQELFRTLVEQSGKDEAHLDDQIAAPPIGRHHTTLTQSESLPRLRSGRNADPGATFGRGNLDFPAARRPVYVDRHPD